MSIIDNSSLSLGNAYNILDKYSVDPKLYGMKWFMTAFTSILKIDILYYFLDYLIQIADSSFLFYFFLATIKVNRKKILENENMMMHMEILTKLNIDSISDLSDIMSIAMDLRKETPYSFQILINDLKIFQKNITTEELYNKYPFEGKSVPQDSPGSVLSDGEEMNFRIIFLPVSIT